MTPVAKLKAAGRSRLRRMPPARRQRWVLAERALRALPATAPVRLLDVGCEDGLFTIDQAVRRPAWQVVGLDLAGWAVRDAVDEARRRQVPNVTFLQADATRTYAVASADAVLALECLAEIPDDVAAVAAMAGALRPGGLLVLHVPTEDWRPVFAGSQARWRREVRHGYSPASISALLEQAGFADIQVTGTMRTTVTAAQELRDRSKTAPGRLRILQYPLMVAAAHADVLGATWGQPRGLFVRAVRR